MSNKGVRGTVIKFKGRDIIVTKDIMQVLTGAVLILLSVIMSGFFAFVSVGFDIKRLADGSFWLAYFLTLATMYVGFFGVYVIREGRNKRQPKIIINNQARRDFRDAIVSNRKIESCENWLKIYNYARRVEIHKDNLTEAYRKISTPTPDKSLDPNSKKYKRQQALYIKAQEKKKEIKKQLDYVATHEQIIAKLKLNDKEGAKKLRETLGDDDSFKCAKIVWRNVYFNDLFNGSMRHDSNSIFYNKSRAIWDNIKLALLLSILGTALTTSMLLSAKTIDIFTVLTIIANLAMLCCYALMAMRVADNVVFEVIYPADENKLTICNLFKEDDERISAKWIDIEEDEEKEKQDTQEDEEADNEKDDLEDNS